MNTIETAGGPAKAKWNLLEPPKRRLRERFADWLRAKNYRPATISAYVSNVLAFVMFHGKRDPQEMGALEVQQFLTMLAVQRDVSWKTQNQNLCALVKFYDDFLGHSRVETTMIYNHVALPAERRIVSPLDA